MKQDLILIILLCFAIHFYLSAVLITTIMSAIAFDKTFLFCFIWSIILWPLMLVFALLHFLEIEGSVASVKEN